MFLCLTGFSPLMNRSRFRQAIICCDKEIMTHIFAYLLSRREELKMRAYVARFLVRIEVSPEVEGDNDIVQLNEQVACEQPKKERKAH